MSLSNISSEKFWRVKKSETSFNSSKSIQLPVQGFLENISKNEDEGEFIWESEVEPSFCVE